MFPGQDDDETLLAQRARVRELLAMKSSNRGKKHIKFLNRNLNAAVIVRRCTVLNMRPAELERANFMGKPLRLELRKEKQKLIPMAGRKRRGGVCV